MPDRRFLRSLTLMAAVSLLAACSVAREGVPDAFESSGAPLPTTAGPGVTETTVNVAAVSYQDFNKLAYDAVVAGINADGGIAGRKVVLTAAPGQDISAETSAAQAQATCQAMRDSPGGYFAILGGDLFAASGSFQACLSRQGQVSVVSGLQPVDSADLEKAPFVAGPALTWEATARAMSDQLTRTGFFDGAKTVVVLVGTDPAASTTSAEQILVPAIKAAGVTDVQLVTQRTLDITADTTASSASTALKIKTLRPDRIVVFGTDYALTDAIQATSEQRVTAPVASLQSLSLTGGLDAEGMGLATAPASRIEGSKVLKWLNSVPVAGLGEASREAEADAAAGRTPTSSAADTPRATALKRCARYAAEARLVAASLRDALPACDYLFFLQAAIEAGGGQVNAESFIAGVRRLRGVGAIESFGTDYTAGPVSVSSTVLTSWDAKCLCYTGDQAVPVPAP